MHHVQAYAVTRREAECSRDIHHPVGEEEIGGFLTLLLVLERGKIRQAGTVIRRIPAWMKRDVVFHHAKFVDERQCRLLPGDVLDLSNEDRYRLTRTTIST